MLPKSQPISGVNNVLPLQHEPASKILQRINQARSVLGMALLHKLPRGIPETARKCVLGRSLTLDILLDDHDRAYALVLHYRTALRLAHAWDVVRPYGMWNGWAVVLPPELNDFVRDFDSHYYPWMESPQPKLNVDPQTGLRHSSFSWNSQHATVSSLLERAQAACRYAQETLRNLPVESRAYRQHRSHSHPHGGSRA
jgi:hypothetical protein